MAHLISLDFIINVYNGVKLAREKGSNVITTTISSCTEITINIT